MNLLLLSVLLVWCIQNGSAYSPWNYNGSTPNLENILTGRCWQYQVLESVEQEKSLKVELDCQKVVWTLFKQAFANKDACKKNTTIDDYEPLIQNITNSEKLSNKAMFWSGTRGFVHDFTHVNNNYITLEDTFTGYIANDLRWCGCENCSATDGINFYACNKSCPDPTTPYWNSVSKQFAEKAAGTVYVMVNGTSKGRNTAYYRGSTFGRIELPTLGGTKQVENLSVLVVTDVDEEAKEMCGTGTLIQLYEDAKKYGIPKVSCTDDPRMVEAVLCAKYPLAEKCREKDDVDDTDKWKDVSYASITVAGLFLVVIVILLIVICRKRKILTSYYNNLTETLI